MAEALESDFKMEKCLDWYTEIPFIGRSRTSPTFIIQDIECFLQCVYNDARYSDYRVYLKPRDSCAELKSFPLTITFLYNKGWEGYFSRKNEKFKKSEDSIFQFGKNCFQEEGMLSKGVFIKFLFQFQNSVKLSLPTDSNLEEKSTQANLVFLQTDMEYLSLDFGALLKTGNHSDVQLLCNGGIIPAHKAILAARSQEFSDMFRDDKEDNENGLISLSTTELSLMELCLEFVYKGKILMLPVEMAPNLYTLGHVLKIFSLPKLCADLMVSNVCESTYISYLILADKYEDDYFKGGLIDYISDHTELLKSESWMKFSAEYMKTAISVYQKVHV